MCVWGGGGGCPPSVAAFALRDVGDMREREVLFDGRSPLCIHTSRLLLVSDTVCLYTVQSLAQEGVQQSGCC